MTKPHEDAASTDKPLDFIRSIIQEDLARQVELWDGIQKQYASLPSPSPGG